MLTDYRSPIEQLPEFVAGETIFFADSPAYFDKFPKALTNSSQLELLLNRLKLREFCTARKIATPAFFA